MGDRKWGSEGILFRLKDDVLASAIRSLLTWIFLRKVGRLCGAGLAQKCDVDHSNISKIEKGEVDLRISTIQELAKGLEVHPQELFDFKIDEKS